MKITQNTKSEKMALKSGDLEPGVTEVMYYLLIYFTGQFLKPVVY